MNGAIDAAKITGGIDTDERLGTAKEFPLTTEDRPGSKRFYGVQGPYLLCDDAIYKVRIDIKKG